MNLSRFRDVERGTRAHDDLVVAFSNDDVIQQIVRCYMPADTDDGYYYTCTELEVPVYSGNYIMGYEDMCLLIGDDGPLVHFEFNTGDPSLGELLRQMNTYRACIGDQWNRDGLGDIRHIYVAVFSREYEYRDSLLSQRIDVIERIIGNAFSLRKSDSSTHLIYC